MAKIKTYKDIDSFSTEVLGLSDYDNWLITTKNKIIVSIVKARKQQSISQKDLALIIGTTQSVISRIENGTSRHMTLDYLMRVVSVLGISPNVTLKKAA